MKDFWEPIPELQRLGRGRPGKVPKGKPRVTDGTLASVRRETPKQIIQQLPTGKVIIKNHPDIEDKATAILTDIILSNANSGGTPYAKAQRAIRNTTDIGSAWAVCFFNRSGAVLHADYKIKPYQDILFEQGKVSEFDSNFMPIIDWYTKTDLKAIIWQEQQLAKLYKERGEKYEGDWDLGAIQAVIDAGPGEKDEANKTDSEKNKSASIGYYKIVTFYQKGVGATFFKYAPKIGRVVGKCVSKDPRGIMPIHGLVPEEDEANPLGEPLISISAGKQNLLDFDMQMYQYGQGMGYSPTLKKWGQTPASKIKLAPDHIIEMMGTKATDDVEVVNTGSQASANFNTNYGLVKSQILNELGRRNDQSVSAESGNPGFSKTASGVKDARTTTNISDNHLRKTYELWQGRIDETLLNIHFAHSMGTKELELNPDTVKRYALQDTEMDYDQDFGPITFSVDASTSQTSDNEAENEKLTALLELKMKYGQQPDAKYMRMYNQIVVNAGVDEPKKLTYTDEEIDAQVMTEEFQRNQAVQQMKQQMAQAQVMQQQQAEQQQMAEEDRMLAKQQLMKRGMPEQQAEMQLQAIDGEVMQ